MTPLVNNSRAKGGRSLAEPFEEDLTTGPKLWVVLARAYGALAAFVESRVAAEGLCLSDFMVLEALLHKGPMPISAIGAKVLLANASMTAAVDRLEARGFVERQNSAQDRRARIVALTVTGRKFITEHYERHAADIESVMAGIGMEERNQLRASLKTIGLAAQAAQRNDGGAAVADTSLSSSPNLTNPRRKGTRP